MDHHASDAANHSSNRAAPLALGIIAAATLLLYLSGAYALLWYLQPGRAERVWNSFLRSISDGSGLVPAWYFVALAGAFVLEILVLGWNRSSVRLLLQGSRSARADLITSALHWVGLRPWLIAAASGGALALLNRWLAPLSTIDILGYFGPAWLQVLVVFIVVDFLTYWYHRISHEVSFLWEAHKYHHAATNFTILTGHRIHVLEEVLRELVLLIPLALLHTPAEMYLGLRFGIHFFDLLQHSMVPWDYGWIGRWLIYSPVGHRIHHSAEPEHWDRNYGDILVIWDRVFGTWYDGSLVNAKVDVSDNPYNRRSFATEYLYCAGAYLQQFAWSIRTGLWRTEYQRTLAVQRRQHGNTRSMKSERPSNDDARLRTSA